MKQQSFKQRAGALAVPRVQEIRKKRRSRIKLKIVLCTIVFAAILTGLSYASKGVYARIENVKTEGNKVTDTGDITDLVQEELSGSYLFLFAKNNAFIYPKHKIERILSEKFPRFSSVAVETSDIHTITITVVEREGRYLWCGRDFNGTENSPAFADCYWSDDNGYIFSPAPYFSGSIFLKLYGAGLLKEGDTPVGSHILAGDELARLVYMRDSLEKIGLLSYGILMADDGDYELFVSPIFDPDAIHSKVTFSTNQDFEKIAANLRAALSTEPFATDFKKKFRDLLYIDLRFDNKVYYKFTDTELPKN